MWHSAPDGGATFKTKDNGWIYVSNSERYFGGVSALEFNTQGILIDAYSICSGTHMNCAGGSIEGMKWLSCEETNIGQVLNVTLMVIILQKSFRHLVALNMKLLLRIF